VKSFQIASQVRLSPEEAWQHATNPLGVNLEFWPIFRMTFPSSLTSFSEDWRPGQKLCRSWIFLFGIFPVEYDDLALAEVEEGRRFLERSEMFTQKLWQHEREILDSPTGTRIVDRVSFASRLAILERPQLVIFRLVFKYRHFRLRRLYGHGAE
jgi:ligand-binding SRPBCC domain-containing protein